MDDILRAIEKEQLKEREPFNTGDIVRIHERITEGTKERIQVFEGIVLKRSGGGTQEMVTIRKISSGIGVEKTYPVHSPKIERIEVVKEGFVRQSRPYFMRRLRRIR
ncbi:50S ribosomal protein L19 [Candidatus Bipolaricaulota bacterium]|nr:50S ribosomal protein L19 [Candidatus Bipolaricaulota bacterium]TFH07666.1 MAG: 50S ribosomal protein L19 [Candidatus Atribacteria bacterium]